jgi:hypothetical protein
MRLIGDAHIAGIMEGQYCNGSKGEDIDHNIELA